MLRTFLHKVLIPHKRIDIRSLIIIFCDGFSFVFIASNLIEWTRESERNNACQVKFFNTLDEDAFWKSEEKIRWRYVVS